MIDLTSYIPVILSVLVGVLIVALMLAWRALGRWSKSNAVKAENEAWAQVQYFVTVAVQAADQMLAQSSGQEKLNYVLGVLDRQFPDLDEDVIRAIVESTVRQEKVQTKEAA